MFENLPIDPTFVFKEGPVPFTISGPDTSEIEDGAEVLSKEFEEAVVDVIIYE